MTDGGRILVEANNGDWCVSHRFDTKVSLGACFTVGRFCRVYNIGIEVRTGRGRYHDTNIVTFAPRYQLDNRSSYKLAFAQRHLARPVREPFQTLTAE